MTFAIKKGIFCCLIYHSANPKPRSIRIKNEALAKAKGGKAVDIDQDKAM